MNKEMLNLLKRKKELINQIITIREKTNYYELNNLLLISKKYLKDKLISHDVDTFRYGCPIDERIRYPELSYMLSRIHYAEVHVYRWYVCGNPRLIKTIYFINDNGILRSFWGYQLGEGYYLPDYVFYTYE